MRHSVFALLIALLPLRGWVGDAMALNMVHPLLVGNAVTTSQTAQTPSRISPDAHHGTDAPSHAPGPAHADASTEAAASTQATGHAGCAGSTNDVGQHGTCSACDVCNGPALMWSQATPSSTPLRHGHVPPHRVGFASSEPKPGIKPPIS